MAGLKEWFKQDWVDIGSKKKGGGFNKCGRKSASGSKRKYPKCVPAAKAARMTDSQKRSAVARKRAKPQGVGGKPTNVKTGIICNYHGRKFDSCGKFKFMPKCEDVENFPSENDNLKEIPVKNWKQFYFTSLAPFQLALK